MSAAHIVGAGETSYLRHPSEESSTARVLADASRLALEDGGLDPGDIDGPGVASFTLAPDGAIDLALRLGLRVSWMKDARSGGASGLNMLQHATPSSRARG